MAPTYIAAVTLILTELAKLGGFVGSPEQVSGAFVVLLQLGSALMIAVRQVLQGRSTLAGARPRGFRK
jgi:hypothetical protein